MSIEPSVTDAGPIAPKFQEAEFAKFEARAKGLTDLTFVPTTTWEVREDGRSWCSCGKPPKDDGTSCAGKHAGGGFASWGDIPRGTREPGHEGQGRAILTGDNIFVIDTDTEEAEKWAAENLPPTFRVKSGSGRGYHRTYLGFVGCSKLRDGIDVRGEGGLIIAPGSPHYLGGTYVVVDDLPIALAPEWLLEDLRKKGGERKPLSEDIVKSYAHIPRDYRIERARKRLEGHPACDGVENTGNHKRAMGAISMAVRSSGLTTHDMVEEAIADWNARCTKDGQPDPWTGEELDRKINQALHASHIDWKSPGEIELDRILNRAVRGTHLHKPKQAPGLEIQWGGWGELPPPVEYLVEGLIPRESVSVLCATGGCMKTWILLDLACAVDKGAPWLGKYATKKGRALIVDFETGKSNTRRRLYMLGAAGVGALSFPRLKPNTQAFWDELRKVHKERPLDLIVIDSLRKANPGGDEKDSGEAIIPIDFAAEFSEETKATIIFIHHATKASNGNWPDPRGASTIRDQVDALYLLKREADGTLHIKSDKVSDMPEPAPFALRIAFDDVQHTARLSLVTEATAIKATSTPKEDPSLEKSAKDVLKYLSDLALGYGASKKQIERIVGGRKGKATDVLVHLESKGKVYNASVAANGKGHDWRIDSETLQKSRVRGELAHETRGTRYTTVKDLAKHAKVPHQQLELWEKEGLLYWSSGTTSGYLIWRQ